jgi:hypothetical protein
MAHDNQHECCGGCEQLVQIGSPPNAAGAPPGDADEGARPPAPPDAQSPAVEPAAPLGQQLLAALAGRPSIKARELAAALMDNAVAESINQAPLRPGSTRRD